MATKKSEETPAVTPNEAKALATQAKRAKQVISLKTNGFNPKRGKSKLRFDLYVDGMTVADYVAAGGYSADIPWDVKRGFIEVTEKEEAPKS